MLNNILKVLNENIEDISKEIEFENEEEKNKWIDFRNLIFLFEEDLFLTEKNLLQKLLFYCYQRIYKDTFYTDTLTILGIVRKFSGKIKKLRSIKDKSEKEYYKKIENLFFSFTFPNLKKFKVKNRLLKKERNFLIRQTKKEKELIESWAESLLGEIFEFDKDKYI